MSVFLKSVSPSFRDTTQHLTNLVGSNIQHHTHYKEPTNQTRDRETENTERKDFKFYISANLFSAADITSEVKLNSPPPFFFKLFVSY
jgi:hypothetical protein